MASQAGEGRQEQLHRDREAETERQIEEIRNKPVTEFKGIVSGINMRNKFHKNVSSHIDDILFGLTLDVGERGEYNHNLHMLNLPLLSNNEYDSEDVMLAAALALGNSEVVNRVIGCFAKERLGIGLKKFSNRSILNIIKVFQSFEDPDIDHASLSMFFEWGMHPGLRGDQPTLLRPKDAPPYSAKLREWGEKFGMHVSHNSWLQNVGYYEDDYRRFRGSGISWITGSTGKLSYTFDETLHYHQSKRSLLLSNFLCPFTVPYLVEPAKSRWGVRHNQKILARNFNTIHLDDFGSKDKRYQKRCKPNLDAIALAFAKKIAFDMAGEAARRLSQLLKMRGKHEQGISLEHICMNSGKGSDLLQHLAAADKIRISGYKEKIVATLSRTLRKNVPPPTKTELEEGESPQEKLDAEVSTFVGLYLRLIKLSYCEVPLLSGKPPSAFVPTYSVYGEVTRQKDCCFNGQPLLHRTLRRLQVKEERERLALARELVAPGAFYTAIFIVSVWAFLSCICVVCTYQALWYLYPLHSLLFLHVAQAFTLSGMYSSFAIIGRLFQLQVDGSIWQYYWKVTSYSTEFIQRIVAAKLGRPTPYDQQMDLLRERCGVQYKVWKVRMAKREFQAALKRKRITNRESVLLLTEMADRYYETQEEEVVEGAFRAELNEVEQFLKLKVDEGSSCTEVSLSPDDALKSYLVSDKTDERHSSLAQLCDLETAVEECVFFAEGDRVLVKCDDSHSDDADNNHTERTASVVFTTASRVYVHFDGEPAETPVPVPTHLCSILDDGLPLLEDEQVPLLADAPAEYGDETETEGVTIPDETSEDESEASHFSSHAPQPQAKKRARTVEEALVDGGWVLTRENKHIIYTRRVKLTEDGPARKQTVTLSKTASDWRAERNALSVLRRLDGVIEDGPSPAKKSGGVIATVTCSDCKEKKPSTRFTKKQLKNGKKRKCKDCSEQKKQKRA